MHLQATVNYRSKKHRSDQIQMVWNIETRNRLHTWSLRCFVATNIVIGMRTTMTARPASTDAPSCCHNMYTATTICRGADHSTQMKPMLSWKRDASTDIRLTISPTVDVFSDVLVSLRAYINNRNTLNGEPCNNFQQEANNQCIRLNTFIQVISWQCIFLKKSWIGNGSTFW